MAPMYSSQWLTASPSGPTSDSSPWITPLMNRASAVRLGGRHSGSSGPIAPMTITAPARRSRAARGRWRVSDIAAYGHTAELPRFSILVALR
jgi:hypothetical protein